MKIKVYRANWITEDVRIEHRLRLNTVEHVLFYLRTRKMRKIMFNDKCAFYLERRRFPRQRVFMPTVLWHAEHEFGCRKNMPQCHYSRKNYVPARRFGFRVAIWSMRITIRQPTSRNGEHRRRENGRLFPSNRSVVDDSSINSKHDIWTQTKLIIRSFQINRCITAYLGIV